MALLVAAHRASLGLTLFTACSFPQETVHVPGIFEFFGSLQHLWLHSHSFLPYPLRLLALPSVLSFENWVDASLTPQVLHSAHYHVDNAKVCHIVGSSQALLDHGSSSSL